MVTKRVWHGELVSFLRKETTHKLTPCTERSVRGVSRFWHLFAVVCGDSVVGEKVSDLPETNWGPKGTRKVPSTPRNFGPKLSDSQTNRGLGVNNPVPFGDWFRKFEMMSGMHGCKAGCHF